MITILLTDMFPFSTSETFLIEEIPFHKNEVIIVPTYCGKDTSVRELRTLQNPNIRIFRPKSNFFDNSKISRIGKAIQAFSKKYFWIEFIDLLNSKRLNFQRLIQLMSFVSKAYEIEKAVYKEIVKNKRNKNESILFYSYWMNSASLAGILLRNKFPNSKAIARCHGYDLYERKENHYYVTMQEYLATNLNSVYCVSKDGYSLVKSKLSHLEPGTNIAISKLGTKDYGVAEWRSSCSELHIVSCSSVIPLKRLHLIAKALSKVRGIYIKWTHFGEGILLNEIKELVKTVDNVHADFKGQRTQEEIFDFYKSNKVDLFINVSKSEGIPVSIMEAISFGIPIIAPNVGGIKEIVINEINGWLLKPDFSIEELSGVIDSYLKMDEISIRKLRENSRIIWSENFNSQVNFEEFISEISFI